MSPKTALRLLVACHVVGDLFFLIGLTTCLKNLFLLSDQDKSPYTILLLIGVAIALASIFLMKKVQTHIKKIPAGIALITSDRKIVTDYSKKRMIWTSDIERLGLWELEITDQDFYISHEHVTASPNKKTIRMNFKLRAEFRKHAFARDAFIAACKNTNGSLHAMIRATALQPLTEFCAHHSSELATLTQHSSRNQQIAFSNLCVKALRPKLVHLGLDFDECSFQII